LESSAHDCEVLLGYVDDAGMSVAGQLGHTCS
jgi:hypothetical protein